MNNLIIKNLISTLLIILFIVGAGTLLTSFYSVDDGERVIQSRNDKVYRVVGKGYYFHNPFTDKLKHININSRTTSLSHISASTKDNQKVYIDLELGFRISADELDRGFWDFESLRKRFNNLCGNNIPKQVEKSVLKYNYDEIELDLSILNKDITNSLVRPLNNGLIRIEFIEIKNINKRLN